MGTGEKPRSSAIRTPRWRGTNRPADAFYELDSFESRGIPFVVGVNHVRPARSAGRAAPVLARAGDRARRGRHGLIS